ncbi:hypothetical protein [Bacillus sp. FSL W8-0672]
MDLFYEDKNKDFDIVIEMMTHVVRAAISDIEKESKKSEEGR